MPLIRTTGEFPPSGFEFIDSRSGRRFAGTEADFEGQIAKIVQHRLSNYGPGRLYDPNKGDGKYIDVGEVRKELDDYTCLRLGNDPRFCIGAQQVEQIKYAAAYRAQADQKKCPKCGHSPLGELTCAVCSGRRVIGAKCDKCGFEIHK